MTAPRWLRSEFRSRGIVPAVGGGEVRKWVSKDPTHTPVDRQSLSGVLAVSAMEAETWPHKTLWWFWGEQLISYTLTAADDDAL